MFDAIEDEFHADVKRFGWRSGIKVQLMKRYLRKTRDIQGMKIFECDWDLLIVLDACRYDLFSEATHEYNWLEAPKSALSDASTTYSWMERNFNNSYSSKMSATSYVCGNPHSGLLLSEDDFADLEEVWKYFWDDDNGTVPPQAITDQSIRFGREKEPDRLLVHYMQPHTPFLDDESSPPLTLNNFGSNMYDASWDDWVLLGRGKRDLDDVWSSYRENLKVVLEHVEILLNNIEAEKVIITSDHGNAAGEYGLYGHPNVPIKELRQVPWVKTTASDEKTHTPAEYDKTEDADINKRLTALGYR